MESKRIYFELTEACNLRCAHCFNNGNAYRNFFLDAEQLIKFREKAKMTFGRNSVLTGGEPLLHPDLEKIVTTLAKDGEVVITTNGTLKEDNYYVDLLSINKNVFFQFSVDGADRDSFEKIRGKGTFDKVINRIKNLCLFGFSNQIGLSMTLSSHNINQVEEIIHFAEELGVHSLHFPTLIYEGNCKNNGELLPDVNLLNQTEELILEKMVNSKKLNISSNTVNIIVGNLVEKENDCVTNPTIKVNPLGDVMICPIMWQKKHSLGNIHSPSIVTDIENKLRETVQRSLICKAIHPDAEAFPKNFCEFCSIRNEYQEEAMKYRCSNLSYHLEKIRKELGEEK